MNLRCIIIDDEPLALDLLEDDISKIPFLTLTHKFQSPFEAIPLLKSGQVDLIFLDIQMPDITGLEFLKSLETKPLVIFTTAYDQYALEGYNLDVIDYLLKPIPFDRLLKAAGKAQDYFKARNPTQQSAPRQPGLEETYPDYIFVKSGYDILRVNIKDILFIEGLKDYVKIFVPPHPILTLMNLKAIVDKLPPNKFVRVHRSYIVALDKIKAIRKSKIIIDSKEIPIGEHYKEAFFQIINEKNL